MTRPGNMVGNGGIDVHLADAHHVVINDFIHAHDDTATTLSAPAAKGDTSINVVSAVGFADIDYVHLGGTPATTEPVHPQITDIIANEIFLDRPLDFDYVAGSDIIKAIVNMKTLTGGTLLDPEVYRYFPMEDRIEHIKFLILSMDHSSAGADDLFGGVARLINGVVLRAQINGEIGTFTNWKTNGDIKLDFGPERVVYAAKAGPGDFGTSARGSFKDLDIAVKLDASKGDFIEVLIQDVFPAGLTDFRIKVQGHVEGV